MPPGAASGATTQARDSGDFTVTKLSDLPAGTGRYVSGAGVRVAYDPRGRSLVAFTAFDTTLAGGRFEVRTGEIDGAANSSSQSLVHVQTVSDTNRDTILADLVTGPSGGLVAMLLGGVRGHDPAPAVSGQTVEAVLLPSGPAGPFSREEVSDVAPATLSPFGLDAARLSNGRVLAAWTTPSQADLFSRRTPETLP